MRSFAFEEPPPLLVRKMSALDKPPLLTANVFYGRPLICLIHKVFLPGVVLRVAIMDVVYTLLRLYPHVSLCCMCLNSKL